MSNDTEKQTNSISYVKLKETKLHCILDSVRISVDIKTENASSFVRAMVYINGVGKPGSEATTSTTYETVDIDVDEKIVCCDLIQIYLMVENGAYAGYVKNFKIKYSNYENQDP